MKYLSKIIMILVFLVCYNAKPLNAEGMNNSNKEMLVEAIIASYFVRNEYYFSIDSDYILTVKIGSLSYTSNDELNFELSEVIMAESIVLSEEERSEIKWILDQQDSLYLLQGYDGLPIYVKMGNCIYMGLMSDPEYNLLSRLVKRLAQLSPFDLIIDGKGEKVEKDHWITIPLWDRSDYSLKGRIRRYFEEVYGPDAVTDIMIEEEIRSLNELLELYLDFSN